MASQRSFNRAALPTVAQIIWGWLRQNLFSSWLNALLTLLCLAGIIWVTKSLGTWIFNQAQWAVVIANLRLILVGRYPVEQLWRLWLALLLLATVKAGSWGILSQWQWRTACLISGVGLGLTGATATVDSTAALWLGLITAGTVAAGYGGAWANQQNVGVRLRPWLPLVWFSTFWVLLWMIGGGLGLTPVSTNFWNGLLLTVLVAAISIVLSFPLGVLLAIGRRSSLPLIKGLSVVYIELVRGLPLIGILFIAQVMFPLLLPPQITLDQLVRAIAGLTLFSAAYLAETVRGGLQSVPNGQWEASRALGFSTPLIWAFVILPQALQAVVPAIVSQFIGLFKDTALLSIVGLVELTGIARSITAQPEYLGRYAEVYLVLGGIYWLFCYSMSIASRRLEHSHFAGTSP
jgi:general L-amino acid transport system permease protein